MLKPLPVKYEMEPGYTSSSRTIRITIIDRELDKNYPGGGVLHDTYTVKLFTGEQEKESWTYWQKEYCIGHYHMERMVIETSFTAAIGVGIK